MQSAGTQVEIIYLTGGDSRGLFNTMTACATGIPFSAVEHKPVSDLCAPVEHRGRIQRSFYFTTSVKDCS